MKKCLLLVLVVILRFDVFAENKPINSQIYFVATAALIPFKYEQRKQDYIKGLGALNSLGLDPFVVEPCSKESRTFLNDYSSNVVYTQSNNFNLRNKGVNEIISMKIAFGQWDFNDDDMIVKITGRYSFNSGHFLNLIRNNPNIDAFAKKSYRDTVTAGCYAFRWRHLKRLIAEVDLASMEKNMIDVEKIIADFLRKIEAEGVKVMYVELLDLSVAIFGRTGPKAVLQY